MRLCSSMTSLDVEHRYSKDFYKMSSKCYAAFRLYFLQSWPEVSALPLLYATIIMIEDRIQ